LLLLKGALTAAVAKYLDLGHQAQISEVSAPAATKPAAALQAPKRCDVRTPRPSAANGRGPAGAMQAALAVALEQQPEIEEF
jgi:hypothetical protein